MKYFLAGGGTGGSIVPLLAVAEEILRQDPRASLYFVGNGTELERRFVQNSKLKIQHLTLPAGKWRRYFSVRNFFDIFKVLAGFVKSFYLLSRHRPDVVFGAGSFVQVPLIWAARFRGIPSVIHQQDIDLLLSTRLCAPAARQITFSFDLTAAELPEFTGLFKKIPKSKSVLTGNPVRSAIAGGTGAAGRKAFGLSEDYPTLLAMGGGTGARAVNQIIAEALPELLKYVQVIHITGKHHTASLEKHPHYRRYEFLDMEKMREAYALADLVICRAGMSTIAELSALGKIAVVVPLPRSAQEDNARYLAYRKAAIVVFQEFFTPEILLKLTRRVLWNQDIQAVLAKNIRKILLARADRKIAKLLIKIAHERAG